MNNYILKKIDLFELEMEEIIYDFKIENSNLPTPWIKIIIHHSGNSNTIQKIIDLHIKKNRWSTIGYHFLISSNGKIYYSRKLNTAGAHCYGYNKNSIGIALLGNFDKIEPTINQIESLKKLIRTLEKNYKIKIILGHNQAIYKLIKEKYFRINLPIVNLIEIESKNKYDLLIKTIATKILKFDANSQTISLIKRLKTCPGIFMYKFLREFK